MLKLILINTILLILFTGCSSNSLTTPPSIKFISHIKKGLNENKLSEKKYLSEAQRQAKTFLKANHFYGKKNYHHACQRYRHLKKDKSFPLKDLAFIRSIKTCKYSKVQLTQKWNTFDSIVPSWLKEEYAKVALKEAIRVKSFEHIARYYSLAAKYKKTKKLKESFAKKAYQAALKTKNATLIDKYKLEYEKRAPRFVKNLNTPQLYFSAGRDWEKVRKFSKARRYFKKIIKSPSAPIELKIKSYKRLAMTYKNQRRKDLYAKKIKSMEEWLKKLVIKDSNIFDQWVDAQISYARAIWTEGDLTSGRKALNYTLKKSNIPHKQLATIYWVLGNMFLEEKNISMALSTLKKATTLSFEDPKLMDKISWAIAWNYYLMEDYKSAEHNFHMASANSENIYVKRKLLFWRAQALKQLKDHDYIDILSDLSKEDSYGYYGILAKIELNGVFKPIKKKAHDTDLELPTLAWLHALKENTIAENYLKKIRSNYRDTDDIEELLPWYQSVSFHEGGIHQFFKITPKDRSEITDKYIDIIYPIPFNAEYKKAAIKSGINLNLLYSISRQESAFNKTIRSWADAFGLMQLTPERAKFLAKKHKLSYTDLNDLYDPYKNILFGALLLKDLKKESNHNFIMTVASYNANQGRVKAWFKTRFDGDNLKFIELIPYEETRNYIKLVFRNYVIYRRLSENKSFKLSYDFFNKF